MTRRANSSAVIFVHDCTNSSVISVRDRTNSLVIFVRDRMNSSVIFVRDRTNSNREIINASDFEQKQSEWAYSKTAAASYCR